MSYLSWLRVFLLLLGSFFSAFTNLLFEDFDRLLFPLDCFDLAEFSDLSAGGFLLAFPPPPALPLLLLWPDDFVPL